MEFFSSNFPINDRPLLSSSPNNGQIRYDCCINIFFSKLYLNGKRFCFDSKRYIE
jgi:hypothetical protein